MLQILTHFSLSPTPFRRESHYSNKMHKSEANHTYQVLRPSNYTLFVLLFRYAPLSCDFNIDAHCPTLTLRGDLMESL